MLIITICRNDSVYVALGHGYTHEVTQLSNMVNVFGVDHKRRKLDLNDCAT